MVAEHRESLAALATEHARELRLRDEGIRAAEAAGVATLNVAVAKHETQFALTLAEKEAERRRLEAQHAAALHAVEGQKGELREALAMQAEEQRGTQRRLHEAGEEVQRLHRARKKAQRDDQAIFDQIQRMSAVTVGTVVSGRGGAPGSGSRTTPTRGTVG